MWNNVMEKKIIWRDWILSIGGVKTLWVFPWLPLRSERQLTPYTQTHTLAHSLQHTYRLHRHILYTKRALKSCLKRTFSWMSWCLTSRGGAAMAQQLASSAVQINKKSSQRGKATGGTKATLRWGWAVQCRCWQVNTVNRDCFMALLVRTSR